MYVCTCMHMAGKIYCALATLGGVSGCGLRNVSIRCFATCISINKTIKRRLDRKVILSQVNAFYKEKVLLRSWICKNIALYFFGSAIENKTEAIYS